MADREKVIKALECCIKDSEHTNDNPCFRCPYSCQCEEGNYSALKEDALELLKEKECKGCSTIFNVAYKAGRDSVVRCKDCIHKNELNHCPHNNDIWVADGWFCADGERRTDNA